MNTTIEFSMFELVLVPNFSFNINSFDFLEQIAQKGYFCSKKRNLNTPIEFCMFDLN